MHELSIALSIIEIVRSNIPTEDADLVRSVRVKVGDISGVVPESLEFCFTAITHDTPLKEATLEVEHVPFVLRCKTCDASFESEMGIVLCPKCGGADTQVLSGFELQVMEIELDDRVPQPDNVLSEGSRT
jgi:hydrogenase nickel incorporation protein HypA/HybF